MPCNAVATVQARVANEEIARLLTPEVVRPLLAAYLSAQYPQWPAYEVALARGVGYGLGRRGEYGQVRWQGGQIEVQGSYLVNVNQLRDELLHLLHLAGGRLFQQQVQTALTTLATDVTATYAPNGALVLTLNI